MNQRAFASHGQRGSVGGPMYMFMLATSPFVALAMAIMWLVRGGTPDLFYLLFLVLAWIVILVWGGREPDLRRFRYKVPWLRWSMLTMLAVTLAGLAAVALHRAPALGWADWTIGAIAIAAPLQASLQPLVSEWRDVMRPVAMPEALFNAVSAAMTRNFERLNTGDGWRLETLSRMEAAYHAELARSSAQSVPFDEGRFVAELDAIPGFIWEGYAKR